MRVIVVRHHAIDDAGFIADAFAARGAELSVHLFPKGGPLPPLDDVDHVVMLGAVWSVYEDAISDWIGAELDWIRAADAAGVPVLGICFGAQALTDALGGQVERAPRMEIGWTTVETLDPDLIPAGPWLEFHGDLCLPPPGSAAAGAQRAVRPGVQPSAGIWPSSSTRRSTRAQLSRWLSTDARAEAERAGQDPDMLVAQARPRSRTPRSAADHGWSRPRCGSPSSARGSRPTGSRRSSQGAEMRLQT